MNQLKHKLTLLALSTAVFLGSAADLLACPTCRDGIKSSGGDLVGAYQMSIVFMMAMPFLLLGGFSAYMYYEVRKARRQQSAPSEEHSGAAQ